MLFHAVNTVAMREQGRKVHDAEVSRRHRRIQSLVSASERIKISGHCADSIELGDDDDVLRRSSASPAAVAEEVGSGNQPDFRTMSDFRKQPLGALQGLFDAVLQIALRAGDDETGGVVLDGSKVKANAGKHKGGKLRVQRERKAGASFKQE